MDLNRPLSELFFELKLLVVIKDRKLWKLKTDLNLT